MLNEKGKMTLLVIVKRRVFTESLHTVLEVHILFNRHKYYWMTQSLDT